MNKTMIFLGMMSIGITHAQQGRVGINTETPRATLDINGKTLNDQNKTFAQGVSFPNFTTEQRANFRNVLKGTMIYNTTKSCIEICTGTENSIPQWSCLSNDTKNSIESINNWEFLIVRYKAKKINNKDLDLDSRTWWKSGVNNPSPVGCGYSSIGQKQNALVWGGDNRHDGTESILINKQDLIELFLTEGSNLLELRLDLHLWSGEVSELIIELDVYPIGSPQPTLQNNVFNSPVKLKEHFISNTFTWDGKYNMVNSYPNNYKNILIKGTSKCGWNNWELTSGSTPEQRAQSKSYPFSNTKSILFTYDHATGGVKVTPRL